MYVHVCAYVCISTYICAHSELQRERTFVCVCIYTHIYIYAGAAKGDAKRGACKKCGEIGHLAFQCFNRIQMRKQVCVYYAYIHTYIHTYIQTYIQTYTQQEARDQRGNTCTYIHAYKHTYNRNLVKSAWKYVHMHVYIHTYNRKQVYQQHIINRKK
jgi:hypothetical protein